MRALTVSAALVLSLATTACGGKNKADNTVATETNLNDDAAINAALGTDGAASANPTDAKSFATAVAASDLFEIESGKLAKTKASSLEIRAFAGHLVTDHTKSTADLKAAMAKGSPAVTVAPALDAEKQAMLDQLKAASDADFDQTFLSQQMTAHQKALALVKGYASNGDQPALKEFATKASGVIQGHIDRASKIKL